MTLALFAAQLPADDRNIAPGSDDGPMSNQPDVLIVDDGELMLVHKLLRELSVVYWHLAGKSIQNLPEAKKV